MNSIPVDYLNPEWDKKDKVHNWRNYISNDLIKIWDTFSPEQKMVIASNADDQAGNEDWD